MNEANNRGRKNGGIGWVISKRTNKHEVVFVNERMSVLKIGNHALIGVYLTYNDNSFENKIIKEQEFQVLTRMYKNLRDSYSVLILGDFNCDVKRSNSNDKLMNNWLKENKFVCQDILQEKFINYTYFKADAKSWIDHVVTHENNETIKNIKIIDSKWNCGDHLAIAGAVNVETLDMNSHMFNNDKTNDQRIIWNETTKRIYADKLEECLNTINHTFPERYYTDKNTLVSAMGNLIIKLNKALLDATSEITEINLMKRHGIKINGWWNINIEKLYNEYRKAKKNYKNENTTINHILYKNAKRAFRNKQKKMKESKNELEVKKLVKLNYTFKTKKKLFHQKVNGMLNDRIETNIDIDKAGIEIYKLFNETEIENRKILEQNIKLIGEYSKEHFGITYNYKMDEDKLVNIINKLDNNKAPGHNKISHEMIKYGLSEKLIKILKLLYETLINYDVMPKNFNIGIVKLVVKDQSKDLSDINNLRPLTISEGWAIIFEKILLNDIIQTTTLESNQFGFRAKSSCGHAVFMLKELALLNKRQKKRTIICSIDASKAFDKINRIDLWGKMVNKVEPNILRTLINYYSVSKITITINNQMTNTIKTTRGVKQGGPLSPFLFSIYIDELGKKLDEDNSGI
ncbi:RNA-directed DNA polymerase from mobile element jockey-like, partial [Brachionus plicatilis]